MYIHNHLKCRGPDPLCPYCIYFTMFVLGLIGSDRVLVGCMGNVDAIKSLPVFRLSYVNMDH